MTKLLEKAFEKARRLPPERQDSIAAFILDEIAVKDRPARTKKTSGRGRLDALVDEADREIDTGETFPLEFPRRR